MEIKIDIFLNKWTLLIFFFKRFEIIKERKNKITKMTEYSILKYSPLRRYIEE